MTGEPDGLSLKVAVKGICVEADNLLAALSHTANVGKLSAYSDTEPLATQVLVLIEYLTTAIKVLADCHERIEALDAMVNGIPMVGTGCSTK